MARLQPEFRIAGLVVASMMSALAAHAGESEVNRLKQGLQSPIETARVEAIRKLNLAKTDARKAADLLVPLLADKSILVQQAASAVLLKIGEAAVPALANALQSKQAKVRRESLALLDKLGPKAKQAAPALAKLLIGSDNADKQTAQSVLFKIGHDAAPLLIAILTKVENRQHWPLVVSLLVRIEGQTKLPVTGLVTTMASHLNSKDPQIRLAAIGNLQRLGQRAKKAAPEVARLLVDPVANLRGIASNLLLVFGPDAIPALKAQLKQPNSDLRLATVQTLSRFPIRNQDIVPALLPLLTDKEVKIRLAVMGILSQMRSPEFAQLMGSVLRDPDPRMRRAAAQYLRVGPKEGRPALPALVNALGDSDAQVRGLVTLTLRGFGPDAIPAISTDLKSKPAETQLLAVNIIASFGNAGKAAIPLLAERVANDDIALRTASLAALTKMLPDSLPSLKRLLTDKNPTIRLATASAFAAGGPAAKDGTGALVVALMDSDERVRKSAATALARIGPAAIPALLSKIDDHTVEVRVAALNVLANIGPATRTALPGLRKAMKDPQPEVRAAAIRLLIRSIPPGPEAKEFQEPLFLALSDKDWQTRRVASSALAKVGPGAIPGLIDTLEKSQSPAARAEAILALGILGQRAKVAIKPLLGILRDPNHRHLQAQALAALANMNPEAGAALAGLLKDPDTGVRVLATNTLSLEQVNAAKDSLVKMLGDPSDEVRWASAMALARVGPGILQDVEPLLTDPKAEVRAAAIQAVGAFTSLAKLSKCLRDDDGTVQQAAAVHLAKRGSDAFPVLAEALRSKNFRAERAAANTIALMPDRADDLIPVLVEVLLAKETQEPEAVARAIRLVNPIYGARELSSKANLPELKALLKKAGFLEKEYPDVQELVCLAFAERGAAASDVLPLLTELLKNPKTSVNVLAAAARAVNAIGPSDSAFKVAPDLIARIVRGTHEKSSLLREEGMSELMRVGLKANTFEAILAMLSLDVGADEANEWIIHHADASNSWNLAGPNLVRVLALFHGRGKLGPRRLTPAAEVALKAHLWRYLSQPTPGNSATIKPWALAEVNALLPIDKLSWMTSAYIALDILKDDPEYQDRKIQGRTPAEYHQEWTLWWREWAKQRALSGLWSEMGLNSHQAFIWPNLLNMVDLPSDPVLKQRFRMLLDLTMIEEAQISITGVRAGRRGKKNEVGSDLDPWKELLFGEYPRRFTQANINYRGIYWTTTYKLPTAAILLQKLNRPVSHYAITNHHFHGGTVAAFATPHYILASQISQPKGSMEFPGAWHRLVFDDGNAIVCPLYEAGRRHLHHRNVYIFRFASDQHPALEFTTALKIVERDGWIFASNGPAFAGIYFAGGYRLERSNRKGLGRQISEAIYPKATQSTILLHAGDVKTFDSFQKFQDAILKAPLKVTDDSIHYVGPDLPALEFFRDPVRAPLVAGQTLPFRSQTRRYEGPYLQCEVDQPRVTVRVGSHAVVYDFDKNAITDLKAK